MDATIEFFEKESGEVRTNHEYFVLNGEVWRDNYDTCESQQAVVGFDRFVVKVPEIGWRVPALASKEAEIANAALNYVSLFGELQNALGEIARLREAFMNVKATLVLANEMKDGPIVDTIWHGPAETLFDYIDNSFTQPPKETT